MDKERIAELRRLHEAAASTGFVIEGYEDEVEIQVGEYLASLHKQCLEILDELDKASAAQRRIAELEAHVEALRAALQSAKEKWAFVSAHGHGGYDWNADPLYLTRWEGDVFALIANLLARTPAQSLAAVKAEALEIVKQRLYASASKEKDQPYGYSLHPRQWAATCLGCAAEDVSAMQRELISEATRIEKGGA